MDIFEVSILHHVCIVLLLLWLLSSINCCHPVAYFISLLYLYLVHERYVTRLRRKLRFEEKRNSNQRRVLSDSETVRWLNYMMEKIWPVCMEQIVSQKVLLPIIPWFLQKYKPWTVKEAVVQHLYMGRSPPTFTEMRVLPQPTGDDHLVMELGMNFRTADDMSAILAAKLTKRLGFGMWAKLHLTGLHVEGKVLVGVKFLRHWPFLGRLRVCFAEPPYFQMTVKPIFTHGIDVTELPGIAGWLDNLLAFAFEQTLVEPNMLVVDMEKFVAPQPENWFSVDEKEPAAYALVEVIEAADMKPSDLNGLADPYVKGQLGAYRFRTNTQKKTLAPNWHEEFKVPIFTWESPNILAIEAHDKDHFVDDPLGDCSVTIDEFRDGQRHDMWLPLQNIKMGRIHLAITVVEGNKKVPSQSFDAGTLSDDNERNSLAANDTGIQEKPPKVVDEFEPIDIEGQEKTGIWVHRPGSEVSLIWEPKKRKSRLHEAPILVVGTGSFKSTASGSYKNGDGSSSDESQEGSNKGNQPNKVQRGLKKIGSLFHRNSKKDDASGRIEEELVPSPHANLIVDDHLSVLSPVKSSKPEGNDTKESPKGSGQESPSKGHVKDMAKSILKHTFSPKGSKKPLGDSGTVGTQNGIPVESGSSDEGSISSPVRDSGVEGIQVDSKPLSDCGSISFESEQVNEAPMNKVCIEHPQKIGEKNDDLLYWSSHQAQESSEVSK